MPRDNSIGDHLCLGCGRVSSARPWLVADHEYALAYRATYGECPACGTLTQTPMPDGQALASFYPPGYHSFSATGALMRVRIAMRVKRLARRLPAGPGAILDYGCGGGAFITEVARRFPGRRCFGYEIDSADSIEEREGGRLCIVRGDLRQLWARLPDCAAVTLNHVIEHLPDPGAVMTEICSRLTADGIVEGQTPAADSLERRVFGTRWSGFHAPRHTVIFSRSGLRSLLERCGFTSIDVSAAFNPAGIAVSLRAAMQGTKPQPMSREGVSWLAFVGAATGLAVIDHLSGHPGNVDFTAKRATIA